MVDLTRALSNPDVKLMLERLASLRSELLASANDPVVSAPLPMRAGAITNAASVVLVNASGPMHVSDIRSAVERLLSMEVSRHSVNSALWKGSMGEKARFVRVKRGWYEARG